MKKLYTGILSIVLVCCLSFQSWAQNSNETEKEKKEDNKPYLFWGGSLWFGFGTYTYADVNAAFGVQLNKRINIGLTGKYQYYKEKDMLSSGDFQTFETNVYGGSIFSQIVVIEDFRNLFKVKGHSGIIAYVEFEFLNTDYNFVHFNDVTSDRSRYWLYNTLVGGGYFQQLGKKAKSYIVLLWNVTPSDDNPYTYPQFRIGFSITI
jgi:hypothetical protein